jgi:O-antigen ligase
MANEYALVSYPGTAAPRVLPALGFVLLLLLIFIGLDAFQPPPDVAQFGGVQEASRGDTLRQIAYLAVGAMIGLAALRRYGWSLLRAIPVTMLLLLFWCVASAAWAPETGIVLRRAAFEIIVVVSLLLGVETLGAERAFTYWRWVLAGVLVINFISIPLIPAAIHGAGEVDPLLIGNWRGLYGHKNIAGAVCAMTAILFLFTKNGRGNWAGIAIALAACVFLYFTRSKSSLGFLVAALAAGWVYRAGWRDGLSRAILTVGAALLALGAAAFVALDVDVIARALEDPREFTGRSEIWAAELRYIADHPLLGAGFGTFTNTKSQSPLHNYVSGSWVDAVSHGHNGYLQVLVTIGGIGFALLMIATVIVPAIHFWRLNREDEDHKPLLFALFVFAVLHNLMESDFLEGDGATWTALLLVIAALNSERLRTALRFR